jgi:hypothetical protein
MALNARWRAYLALERAMLELDLAADPLADHIRDLMDPLWYALSDEEHRLLDARSVPHPADESLPTLRRVVLPASTPVREAPAA